MRKPRFEDFENALRDEMRKLPVSHASEADIDRMWDRVTTAREDGSGEGISGGDGGRPRRSRKWSPRIAGVSAAAVVVAAVGVGAGLYARGGAAGLTVAGKGPASQYDAQFWQIPTVLQRTPVTKNQQPFTVKVTKWKKSQAGPIIVLTASQPDVTTSSFATFAKPQVQGGSGGGPSTFEQVINQYLVKHHLAPLRKGGQFMMFDYSKSGGVVPGEFNARATASQQVPLKDWRMVLLDISENHGVVRQGSNPFTLKWAKIIQPSYVTLLQSIKNEAGPNAADVKVPWYYVDGKSGYAVLEFKKDNKQYVEIQNFLQNSKGQWKSQGGGTSVMTKGADKKIEKTLHAPVVPFMNGGSTPTNSGGYQINMGFVTNPKVTTVFLTFKNGRPGGKTVTVPVRDGQYVYFEHWKKGHGKIQHLAEIDGINAAGITLFHAKFHLK